jgi:hypothetical protein
VVETMYSICWKDIKNNIWTTQWLYFSEWLFLYLG